MNLRKTENLVAAATVFLAMAMTSCVVAPVIDRLRGDGAARGIDTLPGTGVGTSSVNCKYMWGPWISTGTPGEYERSHITLRQESGSGEGCPSGPQRVTGFTPPTPDPVVFRCVEAYGAGDFDGCRGIYPGSNVIKDAEATGPSISVIVQQPDPLLADSATVYFSDQRLAPFTQAGHIDPASILKRPYTSTRNAIIDPLDITNAYDDDVGGVFLNTRHFLTFTGETRNIRNRELVLVSKPPTHETASDSIPFFEMAIPDADHYPGLRVVFEELVGEGHYVFVGKVNVDGSLALEVDGNEETRGCTGLGLDFVQDSCILVYNSVKLDAMGNRVDAAAADDWAENRLLVVAAAISQIARVFDLTAREAAQVMFTVADKSCSAETWCGAGYLDLNKLFDPETGQVKVVLEAGVSTSSQQGEGSLSFSPGSVSLPGLQDELSVMGFNQYVDNPLNLVRSSESVEASFEPSDTDLRTFGARTGFGFAMSSEAFGYCRNGVCPYVSVRGEAGVKRFASDGLAYFVSYRRTDDFFGGEGTGSLGFGQTDNLAAGIKYTRELDGNLALSLGADLVHGRAGNGELIGDLRGTLFRPGLELRREEPLTSGARRVMTLGLRQNNFTGGFRVPGATHKLRERDWEASLSFEFQH